MFQSLLRRKALNTTLSLTKFQQFSLAMDRQTQLRRGGHRPFRGGRGSGRGRGISREAHQISYNQEQPEASSTVVSTAANTPNSTHGRNTPVPQASLITDDPTSHLSDSKFSDLKGLVDQRLLDAIPFEHMSQVQAATLSTALSGKDVLAQAKTGTGKTLAFLIPAIQRLCSLPRPPSQTSVSVLVLSPTRELALQIEKEALMLLKNLTGSIGVQHVVGGTNITSERKRLNRDRKDLLIATPGRLLDHLDNSGDNLDLKSCFNDLKVLVLDEADRMLDMGFRNELEKIMRAIPDPLQGTAGGRQSLFFSATIPSFVHDVAKLKSDHVFISTLKDEEVNTHEHVPQEYKIIPLRDMLPKALQVALSESLESPKDHKIIVFSPTARATSLAAEIFRHISILDSKHFSTLGPVFEIHSRKSQSARTKTMAEFKASPNGVMFSSDVTARGVDIPGITLVMQLGLPSNSEQYIHRLGRTARAGKEGKGVLILDEHESWFLRSKGVAELPINDMKDDSNSTQFDMCKMIVNHAMDRTDETVKAQAYAAHLGYYKSFLKSMKWNAAELIRQSNLYARHALLWQSPPSVPQSTSPVDHNSVEPGWKPPPLLAKTVGMMGLKGQPGLNIVKELPGKPNGNGNATQGSSRGGDDGRGKRMKMDDSQGGGGGGGRGRGRGRG